MKRKGVAAFSAIVVLIAGASPAVEIPLADVDRWTTLSYRRILPNRVSFAGGALQISVRKSASPLVYKLDSPLQVNGVTVKARWSGELKLPAGSVQGDAGADDFVLKIGIVEAGDHTLNWLQRRIAADWITQLFRLAPEGSGVNRINFLSTTQQQALLGSRRTHPLNDLLYETRITLLEAPAAFQMTHRFDEPVEVLGLWISSDGDDTGSNFDLAIEGITLQVEERLAD